MFESQAIPSSKRIKTALEMFGYNQTIKNIHNLGGGRSSIRVYENIVVKDEWVNKLGLDSLMDNIIEHDLFDAVIINSKDDLANNNNIQSSDGDNNS